jgi:hypothetical protein
MNRAELERRIADERMTELEPHGEQPHWADEFQSWQPLVWTMDAAGSVSPSWVLLDEVEWYEVVAIRMETPGGIDIDVIALMSDDDDWDFE